MRRQTLLSRAIEVQTSKAYRSGTPSRGRASDKLAIFCIEHCPHADKPCDGNCDEYKAFAKKMTKKYTNKRQGAKKQATATVTSL